MDATAFEMGQQAARKLLARIEHPGAPGETILQAPRAWKPAARAAPRPAAR